MLEGSDVRGSTPRAVSTVGGVRLPQGERVSVTSHWGVAGKAATSEPSTHTPPSHIPQVLRGLLAFYLILDNER